MVLRIPDTGRKSLHEIQDVLATMGFASRHECRGVAAQEHREPSELVRSLIVSAWLVPLGVQSKIPTFSICYWQYIA
jgi:hypothetical protein